MVSLRLMSFLDLSEYMMSWRESVASDRKGEHNRRRWENHNNINNIIMLHISAAMPLSECITKLAAQVLSSKSLHWYSHSNGTAYSCVWLTRA